MAAEMRARLFFAGRDCASAPADCKLKKGARVIVLAGNIGVGKSTLLSRLVSEGSKQGRKTVVIPEPVDLWNELGILAMFYNDPKRYGYAFQTLALSSRIDSTWRAIAENPDADEFIIERGPPFDQLFMHLLRGVVSPLETAMYETWCNVYRQVLPFDQGDVRVLMICPSIDVCMERVARRARDGEIVDDNAHNPAHVVESTMAKFDDAVRRARSRIDTNAQSDLRDREGAPISADEKVAGLRAACLMAAKEALDIEYTAMVKAASTPSHSGTAEGGVSREYQERLGRIQEAFLFGKHADEFSDLPPCPYRRENIVVIGPELADRDFRADSPGSAELVKTIYETIP